MINLVIFILLFYPWNNCFWDTEGVGRKCGVPLTKILITEIKLSYPHSEPAWRDEVYWKAYQRIRLFLSYNSKQVPDLPTQSKRHIDSTEYLLSLITSLLCKQPLKNSSNLTFVNYSLLYPISILWKDFDLYIVWTLLVPPPLSNVPTFPLITPPFYPRRY